MTEEIIDQVFWEKHPVPDYLVCENNCDAPGAELMICTKPPFWIAQIFKFDSFEEMSLYLQPYENFSRFMLHYNICIVSKGSMADTSFKLQHVPQSVLEEMLNMYSIIRVSNNKEVEDRHSNHK